MINKLLFATLALVGSSSGLLLAADAFSGSWKLNVAKSTFASDYPVPKELTLTFTEQGANRIQILKGIAADGSPRSLSDDRSQLALLAWIGERVSGRGGSAARPRT